ncbi:hypothetical protein JOM56_012845 [Amanita muscaria]
MRANRGQNMAALIEEENLDEDGKPTKRRTSSRRKSKRKLKPPKSTAAAGPTNDADEDKDDGDYSASDSGGQLNSSSESVGESDVEIVSNDELADMLPSKTAPKTQRTKSGPPKKKSRKAIGEDVEDEASPRNVSVHNRASAEPGTSIPETPANTEAARRNPVYFFYELVSQNTSGQMGDPGDKHYKCYHGNRRILTVTKLMKSNLNGLINHLKTHFPAMHRLYLILKDREESPTPDEIAVASGKKVIDPKSEADYLRRLEDATDNIRKAFAAQEAQAAGPWDQDKFERLLTEWIIACDQPFDEVEKEEFIKLMTYARHPAPTVKLPSCEGVRRRVMKMGENTIGGIHEMFAVCPSQILAAGAFIVIWVLTIHVGSRGENRIISRRVDLKQSVRIPIHRCSLYYK